MKNLLVVLAITPNIIFAAERNNIIIDWNDVIVQKGYVLSLDVHNSKKCSNIWSKTFMRCLFSFL